MEPYGSENFKTLLVQMYKSYLYNLLQVGILKFQIQNFEKKNDWNFT